MKAITIIIAAILGVVIYAGIEENKEWERYSMANNCREAGYISGSTSVGVGIGSGGGTSVIPIATPGKTRYVCDDGVEIYR